MSMGWEDEKIFLPIGQNGKGIYVPKIELFIAGMPKEDLRDLLNRCDAVTAMELRELRKLAGDHFTSLNISTRMATQLLLTLGETEYQNGCREEWALYAHKRVNNGCGCGAAAVVLCGVATIAKLFFAYIC